MKYTPSVRAVYVTRKWRDNALEHQPLTRIGGLSVAQLRNRANVTYFNSTYARAPARFNWMDMSGMKANMVGYSWQNLNQYAYPGLGVRFGSSGYVQASGNLIRCVAGVCKSDYFVSRLVVNTSRTYCQ